MQVFVQRHDGLFLKTKSDWVTCKVDALDFQNCTPAIDFCVEHEIQDVRLCLSFGDPKYDLFLEVFRVETRALLNQNRELRSKNGTLLHELDQIRAEAKERKKQIPFARKSPESKSDGQPR